MIRLIAAGLMLGSTAAAAMADQPGCADPTRMCAKMSPKESAAMASAVASALKAPNRPTAAMISFCKEVAAAGSAAGYYSEQIMNGCLQNELEAATANRKLIGSN
jgi:hypothetical protein